MYVFKFITLSEDTKLTMFQGYPICDMIIKWYERTLSTLVNNHYVHIYHIASNYMHTRRKISRKDKRKLHVGPCSLCIMNSKFVCIFSVGDHEEESWKRVNKIRSVKCKLDYAKDDEPTEDKNKMDFFYYCVLCTYLVCTTLLKNSPLECPQQ